MDKMNITLKSRMIYALDMMQKDIDGIMIADRHQANINEMRSLMIQNYATDLRRTHDSLRRLVERMEKEDDKMDL